jgi:hypothetical protein
MLVCCAAIILMISLTIRPDLFKVMQPAPDVPKVHMKDLLALLPHKGKIHRVDPKFAS